MITSFSNPATDNVGTGTDSKNQITPCQAVLGFGDFYPGVRGTTYILEVVPVEGESFDQASERTWDNIERLIEDDMDSCLRMNMNLSSNDEFNISYVDAVKINGKLFIPSDQLCESPSRA